MLNYGGGGILHIRSIFFFNVFNYQREQFNFFFQYKTAKYSARRAKIEPKIDTFCSIGIRDLAILQVEKVVFWTLSKVFWSCLGRVYESIAVLRGPLFGVFPAPKVDKSPGKSSFLVKIDQL